MAYVSSEFTPSGLEARAPTGASVSASLGNLLNSAFEPLRKRWLYRAVLAELEFYSERNLADIGAARDVREYARRAAGL